MSSDVKMTLTPCVGKVRRLEGRGQGQADLTEAKPQWNAEARNSPPLESKELWTLPCPQDMAGRPGVREAVDTGTEARRVQFLGALTPVPWRLLDLPGSEGREWGLAPGIWAPPSPCPSLGPAHPPAVSQIWSFTGLPFICRLTLSRSNTVGV